MDSELFKALSDNNRLRIVGMLVDGETCACRILEAINIMQPTLSHHMKILQQCGLVRMRKVGQWAYYSIEPAKIDELVSFFQEIRQRLGRRTPCQGID